MSTQFRAVVVSPLTTAGSFHDSRMAKLSSLARQYEIRPDFIPRLRALEGYKIVFLCDDSGSMSTPVDVAPGADAFAPRETRWSELQKTVGVVVELATCLTDSGVDVYFLNRPHMLGVTSAAQVRVAFDAAPPGGFTPLARAVTVTRVLQDNAESLRERRMQLLVATDGEPTDDQGNVNIPGLLAVLKNRPAKCFVQILACTDDAAAVAWLDEADKNIKNLDVTDDFRSERKEILRAQGAGFAFSFGDYVVKALLAPVDPYFDTLDEQKPGCCEVA